MRRIATPGDLRYIATLPVVALLIVVCVFGVGLERWLKWTDNEPKTKL